MSSWRRALGVGAVFLLGAAAVAAAAAPELSRRKISGPGANGWFEIQLDALAQRAIETAWLGDEEGKPVPFLRERDLPSRTVELVVQDRLSGRDEAGSLTVEFAVTGATGETVVRAPQARLLRPGALGIEEVLGEMRLGVRLDAATPWVAEVEVARRLPSGEWSIRDPRVQLYDFGGEFKRTEFSVPRESAQWRLRFRAVQGKLVAVQEVRARIDSTSAARSVVRVPLGVSRRPMGWTLTLDGARRVTGVELRLRGVVAPVQAEVLALDDGDPTGRERLTPAGLAQVWRMPGLNSSEGAVNFWAPVLSERFRVHLPEGVELDAAEALVREESLWFVAEQGRDYYLHFGGEPRRAAGSLAELPQGLDEPVPEVLTLGPRESDPFGQPVHEEIAARLRRWLPWIVGGLVALLALVALRLLRTPAQP